MEITALVQPDLWALGTELLKLEAELHEVVCAENLGAWLVSVRVGTDVRRLRQPLVELLRRQRTRRGIVLFRAGEAPDDLTESDLRLLTELLDLGLFSALRPTREPGLRLSSDQQRRRRRRRLRYPTASRDGRERGQAP